MQWIYRWFKSLFCCSESRMAVTCLCWSRLASCATNVSSGNGLMHTLATTVEHMAEIGQSIGLRFCEVSAFTSSKAE